MFEQDVETVSVVVATFNRADRLRKLIGALQELDFDRPLDLIVVDDCSTDVEVDRLRHEFASDPAIHWLRTETNGGPAAARNLGWRCANGSVIAFTDDDCTPRIDWLTGLTAAIERGADFASGPTHPDPTAPLLRPWSRSMSDAGHGPTFSTCNIAYRRSLLERLSGFDESYRARAGRASWGEDTDLAWRALETGAKHGFDERASVIHEVRDSGWWDYTAERLRSGGVARLVRRHPGYRRHLIAGSFLGPAHPAVLLTIVSTGSLCAAVTRARGHSDIRLAALILASTAPYVYVRTKVWPVSCRRREIPYRLIQLFISDLVEVMAVTYGAVKAKTWLV